MSIASANDIAMATQMGKSQECPLERGDHDACRSGGATAGLDHHEGVHRCGGQVNNGLAPSVRDPAALVAAAATFPIAEIKMSIKVTGDMTSVNRFIALLEKLGD